MCSRKNRPCHWSEELAPGGYKYVFFGESNGGGTPASTPTPTPTRGPRDAQVDAAVYGFDLRPLPLRQRLLHIFSQTHHVLELCGCIRMDMFKDEFVTNENRFLLNSILALSALYLTEAETKVDTPFASSKSVMRYYRSKAQASSRQSSDQPTSKMLSARHPYFTNNYFKSSQSRRIWCWVSVSC